MEIKEDVLLDELEEIFEENRQNYVFNKSCIKDKNFKKIVAIENGCAIGYLVLYLGKNFIQEEGFDINVEIEDNAIYIWHCITSKVHEGKGVQTALFRYVFENFPHRPIYSAVDQVNAKSIGLHKKFNFKPIIAFKKTFEIEEENIVLVKAIS